jgi:hypothetical protein
MKIPSPISSCGFRFVIREGARKKNKNLICCGRELPLSLCIVSSISLHATRQQQPVTIPDLVAVLLCDLHISYRKKGLLCSHRHVEIHSPARLPTQSIVSIPNSLARGGECKNWGEERDCVCEIGEIRIVSMGNEEDKLKTAWRGRRMRKVGREERERVCVRLGRFK